MATDAAGFAVPPNANLNGPRKKSFYAEEEDIEVKPSTELIPDEYEHCTNESVLFHIFRTETPTEVQLAEALLLSVQEIDYRVDSDANIHNLNTFKEFSTDLKTIKKESVGKSALVLVFIGYFGEKDGTLLMLGEEDHPKTVHVKEIWNSFASPNCPELKYKPKILIFCVSKKPVSMVQTDSMRHRTMDFDKVYDFPAESDMLIVYKKVDDPFSRSQTSFLERFCFNIINYSKKYDIIDLISCIHNDSTTSVPLIISTLTRKFYLTPSNEREHLLSLVEYQTNLEETLERIQGDIQKLHEAKKKKEKKFSFSFRKKSEEKPKVVKQKVTTDGETSTSKGTAGSSTAFSSPTNPTIKRLSAGSVPGRRSRQQSESDSVKKKPGWKI